MSRKGYGKHLSNNCCWSSLSQTLLSLTALEDGTDCCLCSAASRSTTPSKGVKVRIWVLQFRGTSVLKGKDGVSWIILGSSLSLSTNSHGPVKQKQTLLQGFCQAHSLRAAEDMLCLHLGWMVPAPHVLAVHLRTQLCCKPHIPVPSKYVLVSSSRSARPSRPLTALSPPMPFCLLQAGCFHRGTPGFSLFNQVS